jgi:DNA-binding MarR family transcriptional regulator
MGIHPTDLHAGEVLEREGAMTIGDLAKAVALTPGAATALVDRLERSGLAVRQPDPHSRRRILVKISKRGGAQAQKLFGPLTSRAGKLLEGYGDKDLALIHKFLVAARTLISEHAEAVRKQSASS